MDNDLKLLELEAPDAPGALVSVYSLDDHQFSKFAEILEAASWYESSGFLNEEEDGGQARSYDYGGEDTNPDSLFDNADGDRAYAEYDEHGEPIGDGNEALTREDEFYSHLEVRREDDGWEQSSDSSVDISKERAGANKGSKDYYEEQIYNYLLNINKNKKTFIYKGTPVDIVANAVYLFLDEYYRTGIISSDNISSFIKLIEQSRTNFYSRLNLFKEYHDEYVDYIRWIESVIFDMESESTSEKGSGARGVSYDEDDDSSQKTDEEPPAVDRGGISEELGAEDDGFSILDDNQVLLLGTLLLDYTNDLELYELYKTEILRAKVAVDSDSPSDESLVSQIVFKTLIIQRPDLVGKNVSIPAFKTALSVFGPSRFSRLSEEEILFEIESKFGEIRKGSADNEDISEEEVGEEYRDVLDEIGESTDDAAEEAFEDLDSISDSISDRINSSFSDLVDKLSSAPEPIISESEISLIRSDSYFSRLVLDENSSHTVKEVLVPAISSFFSIINSDFSKEEGSAYLRVVYKNIIISPYDETISKDMRVFVFNIAAKYLGEKIIGTEPSDIAEKIYLIYKYALFERDVIGSRDGSEEPDALERDDATASIDQRYEVVDYEGLRGVERGKLKRAISGDLKLILSNGAGKSDYISREIYDSQAAGELPKNSTMRQMSDALRPRGKSLDIGEHYFKNLFYSIDFSVQGKTLTPIKKEIIKDIKIDSNSISTFLTYSEEGGAVPNKQNFDKFIIGCTYALGGFVGKFYGGDKEGAISEINTLISSMKIAEENNIKNLMLHSGLSRREAIRFLFENNISISRTITSGHLLRSGKLVEQLKTKHEFVSQLFFFISAVQKNEEFYALRGMGSSERSESEFAKKELDGIFDIAPEYTEKETVIEDYVTSVIRSQVSKIDQLFRVSSEEDGGEGIYGDQSNWSGKDYDDTHANRYVNWENDLGKMMVDRGVIKSNYISRIGNTPGYRKIKCPMCAKDKPIRADMMGEGKLGDLGVKDMDLFLDPFSYTAYSPYKGDGEIVTNDDLLLGSKTAVGAETGLWPPPKDLKQVQNVYYDIDDESNWKTWSQINEMINSSNRDVSIDGLKRQRYAKYLADLERVDVESDDSALWPPPKEYSKNVVSTVYYNYKDPEQWRSWEQIQELISSNDQVRHEEGLLRRAEVYGQLGCSPIASGTKRSSDILARNYMFKCPFEGTNDRCDMSFQSQDADSIAAEPASLSLSLNPGARSFDVESVTYKVKIEAKEYSVLDYDSFSDFAKEAGVSEDEIKKLNPDVSDLDIFGYKKYIVGHESLESAVSRGLRDGLSKNKLTLKDELLKLKNNGDNGSTLSMSNNEYLSDIVRSESSPEVIAALAIDNDDLEYGVISSGIINISNNVIDSQDYWDSIGKDKGAYDKFLDKKTSGGYKFSSTIFPCPCHIDNPDSSMYDKYTVMAVPHAGPVGMWNLKDDVSNVFYHPPTNAAGESKIDSIEFGQIAYLVCGTPTSISRFSRDMNPSNKNTMMSILKEYGESVCNTLIREYGVDIEDLRPILEYISFEKKSASDVASDDAIDRVSGAYSSKRMTKVAELFSSAMARMISKKDDFSDKISNLELICPYGHKFTIRQSWDFGRSHFAYHLQKRKMSMVDKSDPNSEKIMRSGLEKYLPLLQATGLDNLRIALDQTKLFRELGSSAYDSNGDMLKKYSAFHDYIYSDNDKVRGSLLSEQWISKRKKRDYEIRVGDFKSSFLVSIPNADRDEVKQKLSGIIQDLDEDDWRVELLIALAGNNYSLGTRGRNRAIGKFSAYLLKDNRPYDIESARIDFEPIRGLQSYISRESLDSLGKSMDGEGRGFEDTIDQGIEFSSGTVKEFDFVTPGSGKLGDQSVLRQFLAKMLDGDSGVNPNSPEVFDEDRFYLEAVKGIGQSTNKDLGVIPDQFNSFISTIKMYIRIINLYYKKAQEQTIIPFVTGTKEQKEMLSKERRLDDNIKTIPDVKYLEPEVKSLMRMLVSQGYLSKINTESSVDNVSEAISRDIYEKLSEPNAQETRLDLNYPEFMTSASSSKGVIRSSATNLIADLLTLNIINAVSNEGFGLAPKSIRRSSELDAIGQKYDDFKASLQEEFVEIQNDEDLTDEEREDPGLIKDIFTDLFMDMVDIKRGSADDGEIDKFDIVLGIIESLFSALDEISTSAISKDIDSILDNIVGAASDSGIFQRKASFLKLSIPIRKFISSEPGWRKLLSPANKLQFKANQFIIKDDTKADPNERSKAKMVSTTSWNNSVGSFMLEQEDLRHIVGAKMHMAYCLYLIDCLRPIVDIYLEKDSIKYIGYELEILQALKDPDVVVDITEDALDTMVDDFGDLPDSEKDSIVSACIDYMRDNMITGLGSYIVTPFSEAHILLGELMSNSNPIMNSGYINKASDIIRRSVLSASSVEDPPGEKGGGKSYFDNPMYEYFFDRSMVFKTDDISNQRSKDLAPYPCIYRSGKDSHTVRDIYNFGLMPRGRVSVSNEGGRVITDSVTGYNSSRAQWGKIGPTRSDEGRYPPPEGFDIFDGDVDIATSRGKVLDLYDDYAKSKEYQNKKIGFPSLVVPKATIIISINNKKYDISFLVRRTDHPGIMKLRRRISLLSQEKKDYIRAIKTSENYGDKDSADRNSRMLLKIEDSLASLYSRVSDYSIAVSTSLMNKISGKDFGDPYEPSDKTYILKSLPCITEVDFYTAYWLITNPDSAPHPYTSEEDQSNLLMYLFESANLEPIIDSLTKSGIIGATTISDLRPNTFYEIGSIANSAYLNKIKSMHNDAVLFSVKDFGIKKLTINVYSGDSGNVGGASEDVQPIASFDIDPKIKVHDGKTELVGKIHKMFNDEAIDNVRSSYSTVISSETSDMVRFQGDYPYSDGATFGKYYDIQPSSDGAVSSITYSMASLDINNLLSELSEFKKDLDLKKKDKPKISDMKRVQELLILLTPNLKRYADKNYPEVLRKIEPELEELNNELMLKKESLGLLSEKRRKLRGRMTQIRGDISRANKSSGSIDIGSLKEELLSIEVQLSEVDGQLGNLRNNVVPPIKNRVNDLENEIKNKSGIVDGHKFGGVWPGTWMLGRSIKGGRTGGDSSVLFNAAKDLILNNKIHKEPSDEGYTIFELHSKETGRPKLHGLGGEFGASEWITMLEMLCDYFDINSKSSVSENYYTRISDVFDSTKSAESLRIYTNRMVTNTHAVWNSQASSERSAALATRSAVMPSNPYSVFNNVAKYLSERDSAGSTQTYFPTFDKDTDFDMVKKFYKVFINSLGFDRPGASDTDKQMDKELKAAFGAIEAKRVRAKAKFIGSIEKRSVREDIFWRIISAS